MKMELLRWIMADWLSFVACKLRGNKWYRSETMSRVNGNRAAELAQSIFERCVALETVSHNHHPEWLKMIEQEVGELGQMAGQNWGHKP